MPTSTYTPIATQTLGSAQSSVTFNSFAGYTDLEIVCWVAGTSASTDGIIQFNGDTGANYSQTVLRGNGSTATSVRYSECYLNGASTWDSGRNYVVKIHLQNYANTTTYKSFITRTGTAVGSDVATSANLWRNTAAITSLTIKAGSGNIQAGSTFTLYGIKAA